MCMVKSNDPVRGINGAAAQGFINTTWHYFGLADSNGFDLNTGTVCMCVRPLISQPTCIVLF